MTSQNGDPPEGGSAPEPKMVPERDLIAMRKGLEKQVTDTRAELDAASRLASERQDTLLREQAAKQAVDAELQTLKEQAADANKLKSERDTAVTERDAANAKLLEHIKETMAEAYGLPADKLKDKTVGELATMKQALDLAGVKKGGSNRYDGGTGGTGGAPLSNLEQAKQELVLARQSRQQRQSGGDKDYQP